MAAVYACFVTSSLKGGTLMCTHSMSTFICVRPKKQNTMVYTTGVQYVARVSCMAHHGLKKWHITNFKKKKELHFTKFKYLVHNFLLYLEEMQAYYNNYNFVFH